MRVLLAGLFHETHTFVDGVTGLDQFRILRGDELLNCRGDGSPLGGALEAASRFGWDIVPAIDMRAQPSGTVEDNVLSYFWTNLETFVTVAPIYDLDAIFLVLHGAMASKSCFDIEGELLQRIRISLDFHDIPIFGVFDLHANSSQRMADHANCLVAYRQNPHSDACEAAVRAAELLEVALKQGWSVRTFWRHAGIVWPPTGTGTDDLPMRELEALARDMERKNPEVLAVNVVGGFAFADTPDTGVSFTVATRGEEAPAQQLLDELCHLAWERRHEGNKRDPSLATLMAELQQRPSGLTVVAEPSDNIGGGASGGGTGLLRALVENRIDRAAVCICDPLAVQELSDLPPGSVAQVVIGQSADRMSEGSIELDVEVISRSDGRFQLEDRCSHLASIYGDRFDMGPCVVVRHAGITILLNSNKTPPFDLGQWRSQGLEPTEFSVIAAKAAVAHRRAYDPIAARMRWVDTPGPCRSDLHSFDYQHLRRPIWPLD